jgi:hypothetical protein
MCLNTLRLNSMVLYFGERYRYQRVSFLKKKKHKRHSLHVYGLELAFRATIVWMYTLLILNVTAFGILFAVFLCDLFYDLSYFLISMRTVFVFVRHQAFP